MRGKLQELMATQGEVPGPARDEHMEHDYLSSLVIEKLDILLLPSVLFTPSEYHCYHGQDIYRHHLWNLLIACFYTGQDDTFGSSIW